MNVIKGKLDPFFETGTEGVVWSVYEDGQQGYDGLNCLYQGDYLIIYDLEDPSKIVWKGNIDFEYERNYRPYPLNPQYGQQEVLGFWVHGLQKKVDPETWGTWFFKAYPAELYRGGVGYLYQCRSSTIAGYKWNGKGSSWNPEAERTPGDLIIKFKNGTYYRYKNVDFDTANGFMDAKSLGKYHAAHIKNKFEVEKIELLIPNISGATIKEAPLKTKYKDHGSDVAKAWPFPTNKRPEQELDMTQNTPKPVPSIPEIPSEDDYEEFIEWTPQEEEEFLRILKEQDGKDISDL